MLTVKGCYKDGKIELQEPIPANITEAELQVIVLPNPAEQNRTKEQLKAKACSIAREYYEAVHKPLQTEEFVAGKSRITYSGRVFDEQELVNLISSSLDFWLTSGKYTQKFEKSFAEKLYTDGQSFAEAWNFGPNENDTASVEEAIKKLAGFWTGNAQWQINSDDHPHEAGYLKLDSSKARNRLGWKPCWNIEKTLEKTMRWYKIYLKAPQNAIDVTIEQINQYMKDLK